MDKLWAMEVFVRVAEAGSFAAAKCTGKRSLFIMAVASQAGLTTAQCGLRAETCTVTGFPVSMSTSANSPRGPV